MTQSYDVLSAACHHHSFVVFEHAWVEFFREELVFVGSVSKHVVLSEAPSIDTILAQSITVVTTGTYLLDRLPDLNLVVALFKVPLPQTLD